MIWFPNQGPPVLRQLTDGGAQRPCRAMRRPRARAGALQPKRKPRRIESGTELWTGEQVSWATRASGVRPGHDGSAT